jgi:hypothetical protein
MKVIKHKDKWYLQSETGYKEILLSTDTELQKDGVQAIDDEFLEWFVKNPSCEKVEVEDISMQYHEEGYSEYKIIIPKEEPKDVVLGYKTSLDAQMLDRIEPKQEPTMIDDWLDKHGDPEIYKKVERKLELMEAAERFYPISKGGSMWMPSADDCNKANKQEGFIEGAKWQQEQDSNWFNEYQKVEDYIIDKIGDKFLEATPEKHKTASEATIALLENNWKQERMYSEEEVFNICRAFATFVMRTGPSYKKQQEWFEQFKKK